MLGGDSRLNRKRNLLQNIQRHATLLVRADSARLSVEYGVKQVNRELPTLAAFGSIQIEFIA